jgi:hypothetical protein
MRLTIIVMVLLLASQAGTAIVCPAECAPVAMPQTMHHGHEHEMHGSGSDASVSAAQCGKLMVAESTLAKANRVSEFAFDAPASVKVKSSPLAIVQTVSFGAPALEASSPPKFSVLRI